MNKYENAKHQQAYAKYRQQKKLLKNKAPDTVPERPGPDPQKPIFMYKPVHKLLSLKTKHKETFYKIDGHQIMFIIVPIFYSF